MEVEDDYLKTEIVTNITGLDATDKRRELADSSVLIVTIHSTRINTTGRFLHLLKASETVGKVLKKGEVVILYSGCIGSSWHKVELSSFTPGLVSGTIWRLS